MNKDEIENVMYEFINKEHDVLLCTTIIETGIDIPNVNTLIIMDADKYGLAQLYQIRGRVGRSDKIAYCYLMYDNNKILSENANSRLSAIKEFTELGSGFNIAMRDLSIRGAGDILGSEQAGFIDAVGIELFLNMLNDEIRKAKGEVVNTNVDEKPLIDVATSINNDYIMDDELKIEIHKKINMIDSYEMLDKIRYELEDRFGKVTDDMLIYMHQELFEKKCKFLEINKVVQQKNFVKLIFSYKLKIDEIIADIYKISPRFRFSMAEKNLEIILDTPRLEKHFLYYLLDLVSFLEVYLKKH
jgi:transcription-repair coupling factor (superfamily II helicase)